MKLYVTAAMAATLALASAAHAEPGMSTGTQERVDANAGMVFRATFPNGVPMKKAPIVLSVTHGIDPVQDAKVSFELTYPDGKRKTLPRGHISNAPYSAEADLDFPGEYHLTAKVKTGGKSYTQTFDWKAE